MIKPHRLVQMGGEGPVFCQDCGGRWFAAPLSPGVTPGFRWRIEDQRAAHLARTGPLSPWLDRVGLVHLSARRARRAGRKTGDLADDLGLMLTIAAHHHARGWHIPLDNDLWKSAAVTAVLMAEPGRFDGAWAGACILLDAAVERTTGT